jgi:hypothetical protein
MCNATANRANSNPPPFTVIFPRVGVDDKHASKHLFRIGEVEPMLPDVGSIL